jgi:thiamine biosynthesis lipoprotein
MRASIVIAAALCGAIGPLAQASAASAEEPDHLFQRSAKVMGTIVNLTFWTDDDERAADATAAAIREFERIEALMTSWTDDSVVARVNAGAGSRKPVAVDDEIFTVLAQAEKISRMTGGAFDISVGAFFDLWKFGSNQTGEIPTADEIARAVALVDHKEIKLDAKRKTVRLARRGMRIDLGGIAKGYAVDRVVALLHERDFVDFIIQLGGDLYVSGRKGPRPWVVGIRDPRGSRTTPFAITPIENRTFSTSGDYERSFLRDGTRYHHIIDPETGQPARRSRSVTVMAADAMTADVLSTALFVMGVERGMKLVEKLDGVEAVFVDADNRVHVSSGLEGKLRILSPPTPGL